MKRKLDPIAGDRLPLLLGLAGVAAAGLVASLWWRAPVEEVVAMQPTVVAPPLPPAPAAPTPAPTPMTASVNDLVLHGVLGDAAIIARRDGPQRLVRIGRQAAPGLTLKAVAGDSVTLDDHGRAMVLALVGPDGTSPLRSAGSGARDALVAATRSAAKPGVTKIERDRGVGFQRALSPRMSGERIDGYVVNAEAKGTLLDRAGLRPGDVLTGVNGRALLGPADIATLAREATLSPTLRFDYERGGKRSEARVDPGASDR